MPTPTAPSRPDPLFDTCKDVIGADLYRGNAFRILGVSVGASLQSASKSQKLREMQQRLGMTTAGPLGESALLPLPQTPDPEATRRAGEVLQDPLRRFVNAFFWFWPTDTSVASDGSLALLSNGHPAAALAAWQRYLVRDPEAIVVRHNLAVLSHALALDCEAIAKTVPISVDHDRSRWAYWQMAHETWRHLLDAPLFWQRTQSLRDITDDPRLPVDVAHRIRDWLPHVIVTSTCKVALDIAARGSESRQLDSLLSDPAAYFLPHAKAGGSQPSRQRTAPTNSAPSGAADQINHHLRALVTAGWAQRDVDSALEAVLKPTIDELRNLAEKVSRATPSTPRDQLVELLDAVVRRSATAEALLPKQSARRESFLDTTVEALLEAGIAHGNEDKRWAYWLLFNDVLSDLARGAMLKQRLAKTGETLKENAKAAEHDRGFDDAKQALRARMKVDVDVGGQGMRVPQVCTCCLGAAEIERTCSHSWQELQGFQRVQRTIRFAFPICKECARHCDEGWGKCFVLVITPLLVAVLGGYVLGSIEGADGWVVAGVCSAAALVVMGLLATKLKFTPLGDDHACRGCSVVLHPADDHKLSWRLTFSNPVYAHAFAQANAVRKGDPVPSSSYRGRSLLRGEAGIARAVLIAVFSMAASGLGFAIAASDNMRPPARTVQQRNTPQWAAPAPRPAPAPPPVVTTERSDSTWRPAVRIDPNAAEKARLKSAIDTGKIRLVTLEDDVQSTDRRLKLIQSQIDLYKSEIDGYESRNRYGGYVNQSAYQSAIDAHNQQVQAYNLLLVTYRSKYREYKEELDSVNANVDEYNRLIGR